MICDGCKKTDANAQNIQLAPNLKVSLCVDARRTGRHDLDPNKACLVKYMDTHSFCPGCGDVHESSFGGFSVPKLCRTCSECLAIGKKRRDGDENMPAERYAFEAGHLSSGVVESSFRRDLESQCKALTQSLYALGGVECLENRNMGSISGFTVLKIFEDGWGDQRTNTGMDFFFASSVKATLLKDAFSSIRQLLIEAYTYGHKRGNNLLMGLVSGDTTVSDYNEKAISQKAIK